MKQSATAVLLFIFTLYFNGNGSAQTAAQFNQSGMELISQGKINEAVEKFKKAIELD